MNLNASRGRKTRELKNLYSGVNYDRQERGRNRRRERRGTSQSDLYDEYKHMFLECQGVRKEGEKMGGQGSDEKMEV